MWYEGLLALPLWQLMLVTLALTHGTIVAVTVYLHRYSAHRSLELHPALKHCFRFWLWMTTGMVTCEWTAVHRKHHALCETEEDPHSPRNFGIRKVVFEGAELYSKGITPETVARFGKGCPDDWLERNVYGRYRWVGISLMALIDLALFGVNGIWIWAVQMLWIPVLAAGVINGMGHYWGYRNYECPDAATNLVPWGILVGGEELHNNHHAYPNSAKLAQKPWEFDLGFVWIRLFTCLGLASVRSTGPVIVQDASKSTLDSDTILALVNDRFRVMERFRHEVVKPMVAAEQVGTNAATAALLGRMRKLITREQSLVTAQQQEELKQAFARAPTLRKVYEARQRLQDICRTHGSTESRLEALRIWCVEAEESGIQVLHEFAKGLKAYTLPQWVPVGG